MSANKHSAKGKVVVLGLLGLTVALTVAHGFWKGSGSNEWRLERDQDGIKVFTLKAPGSSLLKVKASMQVATSLSSAVELLREDPFANGDYASRDFRVIERIETPGVFLSYYSVKQQMPAPFQPRELVVLLNYAQDPASKRVEINVQAAPSKAPPVENTPRVTHLNNVYRLTPLPDGQVAWEVTADVDMGVPYLLANLTLPGQFFEELNQQKQRVLTQKYQQAKLVSVAELSST
jgi:START domain-containing protein